MHEEEEGAPRAIAAEASSRGPGHRPRLGTTKGGPGVAVASMEISGGDHHSGSPVGDEDFADCPLAEFWDLFSSPFSCFLFYFSSFSLT